MQESFYTVWATNVVPLKGKLIGKIVVECFIFTNILSLEIILGRSIYNVA